MYCMFEAGPMNAKDFARILGGGLKRYNPSCRSWWINDGGAPELAHEIQRENKMGMAFEVGANSHCYVFSCEDIEIRRGAKTGTGANQLNPGRGMNLSGRTARPTLISTAKITT